MVRGGGFWGKWQTFFWFFTGGGGGVLPYMSYIGMCGPKGYVFSAVLVINWYRFKPFCRHFGHK